MSILLEELHRGTSQATNISREHTIILQTHIPLNKNGNTIIYYLGMSSNTLGISISELPNSQQVLESISRETRLNATHLSLPKRCQPTEVNIDMSENPYNRLQFKLTFTVSHTIQQALITLANQLLPNELKNNSSVWITNLRVNVSPQDNALFQYTIETTERELFQNLINTKYIHNVSSQSKNQPTKSLWTNNNKPIPTSSYELIYELVPSENTIKYTISKHLKPIITGFNTNHPNHTLELKELSITARNTTGTLQALLKCPL
jgi:hypothetical protein